MVRIYLAMSALVWIGYGAYLLFVPGALEAIAGVTATNAGGTAELRAMYGGLEVAIGLLCLAGLLRDRFAVPALATLALLCGGLLTGRAIGVLSDPGALDTYNIGALCFEFVLAGSAAWLATRSPDAID